MTSLVDSHCHLDFDALAAERPRVLAQARAAGVGAFLTIGTKITEADAVVAIARDHDDVFCTIGIHPHEAEAQPRTAADALARWAEAPKVVGLGETGLDFHYDHAPRDLQARAFEAHIDAARETGLPLIVHTRSADAETAAILRRACADGRARGVIHCFTSGPELAEIALDLGFYISFSGIVTFKNAADLRAIAARVPLDRLLLETDAPYLAPVPMRGKSNEPAYVVHTARQIAEVRGLTLDALARATSANFFRLFDRATPPAGFEGLAG